MDRRRATAIAAGTALTFLLAASAMTANAVILGRGSDNGVGHLQFVPAAAAAETTTAPAAGASGSTPTTPSTPATVRAGEDEHRDHEAEEPHEGRDDDD